MWTNVCSRRSLQPLKKPFEVGLHSSVLEAPDPAQTTGPAAELCLFIPRMQGWQLILSAKFFLSIPEETSPGLTYSALYVLSNFTTRCQHLYSSQILDSSCAELLQIKNWEGKASLLHLDTELCKNQFFSFFVKNIKANMMFSIAKINLITHHTTTAIFPKSLSQEIKAMTVTDRALLLISCSSPQHCLYD